MSHFHLRAHTEPTFIRPFILGEKLDFKLSYGWFTVGKAQVLLQKDKQVKHNEECLHMQITGNSAGILGKFSKVDDIWAGYIRERDFLPVEVYSHVQEGRFQRRDTTVFLQEKNKIVLEKERRHKTRPTKEFDTKGKVYDLLSGYMLLRNIDYSRLQKNDTVSFTAFYDENFYELKVIYRGIDRVSAKTGKVNAHKITPILPPNELFEGKMPVTAWISADQFQLPLKIEAELYFGKASVDLMDYSK